MSIQDDHNDHYFGEKDEDFVNKPKKERDEN